MQNNASNNNNSQMVGIKDSWSLLAFAKSHGKMQVGEFTNGDGDKFKSCVFTSPVDGSVCFVGFSGNLGEMSPAQIVAQKDNLQVVELESGNFKLCQKGNSSWQDVDLF